MNILAVDTAGKTVGVALMQGDRLLYECYLDAGMTHSETLMPLIDGCLRLCGLGCKDIDLFGVNAGPGSFTGLRIGLAAVKGLAWAADKPCLGVSTLEAMAQNAAHIDGLIVGAMDARRSQVYNAVFEAKGGELTRLTPDRAISLEELCAQLQGKQQPITVLGDGGVLCYRYLEEHGVKCSLAPSMLLYQSAVGVGLAAERAYARRERAGASPRLSAPRAGRAPEKLQIEPVSKNTLKYIFSEVKAMEAKFNEKVHIMNHPLVAHKLTIMRDENTSVKDFRELVSEIGMLITYEATRDLPLTTKHIKTPICEMDAPTLAGKKFVVVPILRAGLGLVDGVLRMVPSARVGHIGMYRDEETLEPHPYFCKMPKDVAERDVMIVDPMLATGGSACEAIGEMVKRGCKHITLMVLVAAPEGIKAVQEKYPDVNIYAGALDDHLNEHGYIVPGLGDAGDRIFGTK
jgi:uracil phosphoribosyltransferase